jgi:N-methylhydantoinase A
VDIGGTFTDCVLVDREGNHRTAKVLSTKDDPVTGVVARLRRLAEAVGVDLPTLLERTERLGHGTTIGTNAVLERRGARTGLVATAGHGDALAMMRGAGRVAGRVAGRPIDAVFSVHDNPADRNLADHGRGWPSGSALPPRTGRRRVPPGAAGHQQR